MIKTDNPLESVFEKLSPQSSPLPSPIKYIKSMNSIKPTSVLSFDIGSKRIGLAGCDPLGITVTPLKPLLRCNFQRELHYLKELCKKRNVKGLVFGLPLDDAGKSTHQSEYSKNYGLKVSLALRLPFAWVNEHSSTWQAQELFNLKKDSSGKLDSASAVIILEQWLKDGPNLATIDPT